MVPGEAHLVVAAAGALDGHVELVAYSQVLFLKQNLRSKQMTKKGTDKGRRNIKGEMMSVFYH